MYYIRNVDWLSLTEFKQTVGNEYINVSHIGLSEKRTKVPNGKDKTDPDVKNYINIRRRVLTIDFLKLNGTHLFDVFLDLNTFYIEFIQSEMFFR